MATSLVQKKDATSVATASLVVTLDAVPRSGNTLIISVVNGGTFITSVTGGGVTAWGSRVIGDNTNQTVEIWRGVVDTTPAAAVTINLTSSDIAAKVMEFAGVLTVDQTAHASGTSVTIDPSAVVPTRGDELIVAVGSSSGTPSAGPTNGFADQGVLNSGGGRFLDTGTLPQVAPASITTQWTITSAAWSAVIASFISASAGRYAPVRIASKRVGPAVMRFRFRKPFYAQPGPPPPPFDPSPFAGMFGDAPTGQVGVPWIFGDVVVGVDTGIAFDPALMDFGLDAQQGRDNRQVWYQPEGSVEGLTPPTAFDPSPFAGEFGWDAIERGNAPVWFASEASTEGLTPPTVAFDPSPFAGDFGWDAAQDRPTPLAGPPEEAWRVIAPPGNVSGFGFSPITQPLHSTVSWTDPTSSGSSPLASVQIWHRPATAGATFDPTTWVLDGTVGAGVQTFDLYWGLFNDYDAVGGAFHQIFIAAVPVNAEGLVDPAPLIAHGPLDLSSVPQLLDQDPQPANAQRWFQPDGPTETPLPPTVTAFDPATMDFGLDVQTDRNLRQSWFAPEASAEGLTPLASAFDPATIDYGYDARSDRSIQPTWFAPDASAEGLTPPVQAFDPATVDWGYDPAQDRSTIASWFAVEPSADGLVPPFDPTLFIPSDSPLDRSTQPVWFTPDLPAEGFVPALTPDQFAGLWQDQSGQQDRGNQALWHLPDALLAFVATVIVPATVTGGYPPMGLASAPRGRGGALAGRPDGSGRATRPEGGASAARPDGRAINPR